MSPSANGVRLRGYRVTPARAGEEGAARGVPAFHPVDETMLLDGPVSLDRFRRPRILPAAALFTGELPPGASVGLASIAVAGVFAAVEVAGEGLGCFLLGDSPLPDQALQEELRLTLDGRVIATFRIADLGDPGAVLPRLASAAGGLRRGQVVFLCAPDGPAARAGTLMVAGARGCALIGRIEG